MQVIIGDTIKLNNIFNLKKPLRVFSCAPMWKGVETNGLYEWNDNEEYHHITINADIEWGSKQYHDILAHEHIHAWQCEMGLKLSHGKVFKWWAEELAQHGYSVSKRQ